MLRSLPLKSPRDIDSIPLTELIGNLQTYELGLVRIGKGSKSKNMALKAKNDEDDELSKDENSKFNLTFPNNSRSSSRMRMSKQMTGITSSLDSLNLKLKRNSKENPKKVGKATTFQPVQNAMGVKGTNT